MELDPASRSFRLREMYWSKTHIEGMTRKEVVGSGEDTLTGHGKDFAALLEASDPFIQPDELNNIFNSETGIGQHLLKLIQDKVEKVNEKRRKEE